MFFNKFCPQLKTSPSIICTTMPSAAEKLEQLAALRRECQCKEEEERQRELEEEEELRAEMRREEAARLEAERLEAERVAEELQKAEEARKIAEEAWIAAEEAWKKEEAAKAAALHKEAREANMTKGGGDSKNSGGCRRKWRDKGNQATVCGSRWGHSH